MAKGFWKAQIMSASRFRSLSIEKKRDYGQASQKEHVSVNEWGFPKNNTKGFLMHAHLGVCIYAKFSGKPRF